MLSALQGTGEGPEGSASSDSSTPAPPPQQPQVWAASPRQAREGKHNFTSKLSSVLEIQTPREAKKWSCLNSHLWESVFFISLSEEVSVAAARVWGEHRARGRPPPLFLALHGVPGWEGSWASLQQNKYLLALYTRILLSSLYLHCKCSVNSKAVMCTWNLPFVWGHRIYRRGEEWALEERGVPWTSGQTQSLQQELLARADT